MGGLDGVLTGNHEALEILPIEERALITNGLPNELRIKDIAALSDPENKLKQESTIKALVDLCKAGRLHYYGDIDGWSYQDDSLNPYPKIKGEPLSNVIIDLWAPVTLYAYSYDCLIRREDFKLYLQRENLWPVDGLLANWWKDSVPQAGAVGDADKSIKKEKKQNGCTDKLRTTHFMEWVSRTNYDGNQTNYYLQDELRKDKPFLWGKNEATFNKWLQSDAALPAKVLLDELKIKARQAV